MRIGLSEAGFSRVFYEAFGEVREIPSPDDVGRKRSDVIIYYYIIACVWVRMNSVSVIFFALWLFN